MGEEIDEFIENVLLPVLTLYGFNTDGLLINPSQLSSDVLHPQLNQAKLDEIKQQIFLAAETYNKNVTDDEEKIQDEICKTEQIIHPCDEVSVSVDEILVKAQRPTRRKKGQKVTKEKKRKYIPSTVVSITSAEGTMPLVADSAAKVLKMALAVMLKHNLLANKALVFYTDGQETINTAIRTLFSFREFSIKLDYFHLKRKCYEYLTMAIKGGKKNFERNKMLRKKLYSRLFVHNIKAALSYLDNLDESVVKNREYIEKLKAYIKRKEQYMYCYALSKMLHCKNASNDVENANNRLIADRCKNNGTSWLDVGLNGMRDIRWLHNNLEVEWYFTKQISFNLNPLTKELKRRYSWLDNHYQVA